MLVAKAEGDEVYAGTINDDGALELESTNARRTIRRSSRIIRMVEDAQSRRARSEQWVEKFARVYTPAVIVLALAVFLVPPLALGAAWGEWFYRALVLLVIACPCALVISTPVTHRRGPGERRAARRADQGRVLPRAAGRALLQSHSTRPAPSPAGSRAWWR
ncbi:MAG: hypothetical protein U5K43_07150 [Halofilum sp. (in: g-proteobacteria)]|nr:hypothetical protein [Halofilum sp. (in: g-proteobacteria)]